MIEDPLYAESHHGRIEVICGCMFSGKTEELIRRINSAKIALQEVIVFKPKLENRYDEQKVVSHDKNAVDATPVASASEILVKGMGTKVVAIDEAQFFDGNIVEVCNQLANSGIRVIVAGLDMDYQGRPFGPMPNLMAVAEFVTKLHAVCSVSGGIASYSYRKTESDEKILLGANDRYEARSRQHFNQ